MEFSIVKKPGGPQESIFSPFGSPQFNSHKHRWSSEVGQTSQNWESSQDGFAHSENA